MWWAGDRANRSGTRAVGLAIAGLVAAAAAVGCERQHPPPPSAITSLRFTSVALVPLDGFTPVDVTVADRASAQSIYLRTIQLPDPAPGVFSCPISFAVTYDLAFASADDPAFVTANIDPGGCRPAMVSVLSGVRDTTDDYWSALAQAVGIPLDKLFDLPLPPRRQLPNDGGGT
jgi:hypothetical protein